MTTFVIVPAYLARMRVIVDQGIHWNPVDRLVLWSLSQTAATPSDLARDIDLPKRVVTEMIWKLMRFGWIEVVPDGAALRPTMAGLRALHVPDGLPSLIWPDQRTVRAVIEPTEGRAYPSSDVVVRHRHDIDAMAAQHELRWVNIKEVRLPTFEELGEAAQICLRNSEEEFVRLVPDRSKADLRYMVVTVHGNEFHGLPPSAPASLIDVVRTAANSAIGSTSPEVSRAARAVVERPEVAAVSLDADDIILDGASHREAIGAILRAARHRVVLHSTFVSLNGFEAIRDDIRAAVQNGAQIDILYGADKDERTRERNGKEARRISGAILNDPVLRQHVHVHMRSTQSHAKVLVADTGKVDEFVAIVGSCNWLSTPYKRVEASFMLRDGRVIAHILRAIGEMSFVVSRTSPLVGHLDDIARDLERRAVPAGEATVRLVLGEEHGLLMHRARDEADAGIWVGADRFGQVAEVKTLIPMMTAGKSGVEGRVLFSRCVTPVSDEDLQDLAFRAAEDGVTLTEVDEGVLHGKFLIWDEDNVVITSLNWSSAGTRRDNPWGEIGLHVRQRAIASKLRTRIMASLEAAKLARLAENVGRVDKPRRQRR